jgi:hypothetical protein
MNDDSSLGIRSRPEESSYLIAIGFDTRVSQLS